MTATWPPRDRHVAATNQPAARGRHRRLASAEEGTLDSRLILAQHAPGWAAAVPGARHYLYRVPRSRSHLTPPSLAAALHLLALRWLCHDYASAFSLCPLCVTDRPFSAEEAQLWVRHAAAARPPRNRHATAISHRHVSPPCLTGTSPP